MVVLIKTAPANDKNVCMFLLGTSSYPIVELLLLRLLMKGFDCDF